MRRAESRWKLFLQEQWLVIGAGLAAAALLVAGRVDPHRVPEVVDLDLLLLLFALIFGVELIRESNFLENAAISLISRFRGSRSFTLASIVFAGGLACLVTNDVAHPTLTTGLQVGDHEGPVRLHQRGEPAVGGGVHRAGHVHGAPRPLPISAA